MKFPFNKFTNNLVFFLILCLIIIIFYFFFFRYKEGAWGRSISKQVKQNQSTNNSKSSSTSTNTQTTTPTSPQTIATIASYSIHTYSSTPTIVPPNCNVMTNDQCSQNSGFCIWDNITSGCINKLDCANLDQTNCSKQNYCAWNSSINKCSIKT